MDEDVAESVGVLGICEKFGWTFDYVREMAITDLMVVVGYMEGQRKLEEFYAQRRKK